LALGAQRLLPVLQQAYGSWAIIQSGHVSLRDTLELLDQRIPVYADKAPEGHLTFKDNISLNEIGFQYSLKMPYVIKGLNLTIAKGSRVGFVGSTGSGKSTLLDIVMGLLQPTHGSLEVDGVKVTTANTHLWQAHIAHVPQTIFLADSSIEENIAFGIPRDEINLMAVRRSAKQAKILDLIDSSSDTGVVKVGERGVRLSGGQRQRIALARALLRKPELLILDEATSSLDSESEQLIQLSIDQIAHNTTILIVAHRLSTIAKANQVYVLSNGEIIEEGSFNVLSNKNGGVLNDMLLKQVPLEKNQIL
jgi:ATP-binding cassette subfamily B protein